MKIIDIRSIIEKSGLGIEEAAFKLFPNHSSPYHALRRIMNGEGSLKTEDIVKLSEITGFEIGSLFNPKIWEVTAGAQQHKQILRMRSSEYVAELDMSTLKTTVVKLGSSDIRTFWVSSETPFKDYLCQLTEFVSN